MSRDEMYSPEYLKADEFVKTNMYESETEIFLSAERAATYYKIREDENNEL